MVSENIFFARRHRKLKEKLGPRTGGDGILVFLIILILSHVLLIGDARADDPRVEKWPVCRAIRDGIRALPGSTPIFDAVGLIKGPGITHPVWNSIDPTSNLNVIRNSYLSNRNPNGYSDPSYEDDWNHFKQNLLIKYKRNIPVLEEAQVNLGREDGIAKIYRIQYDIYSWGDIIHDKIRHRGMNIGWLYIMVSNSINHDINNQLIRLNKSAEIIYYYNSPFFISLPHGYIYKLRAVPNIGEEEVCTLRLSQGVKF